MASRPSPRGRRTAKRISDPTPHYEQLSFDFTTQAPETNVSENPAATDTPQPGELETLPEHFYGFDSSRVQEAGYDPGSQRLYVRFVKPVPGGTPWVYEGVPRNVWRNFRRSASAGKYINRVLNGYNYHRGDF